MKKDKGFTLIELLIAVAIIGVLATLAVVAMNNAREKSRDAKRVSDIKHITTALELYFSDNSSYPVVSNLVLGSVNVQCLDKGGFVAACATEPTYLPRVPANPSPGGAPYLYTSANGSTYTITFTLEGGSGDLAAGSHAATPSSLQ